MSYLLGSGWWIAWYLLLWALAAPFVALAIAFARATPNQTSPPLDTAFALASVGLAGLLGATVISALLWTAALPASGLWAFVRNGAIAAAGSLILGLLVAFPGAMYVASHTYPMGSRWRALLLCLAVVAGLLVFSLHATWRFRQR